MRGEGEGELCVPHEQCRVYMKRSSSRVSVLTSKCLRISTLAAVSAVGSPLNATKRARRRPRNKPREVGRLAMGACVPKIGGLRDELEEFVIF